MKYKYRFKPSLLPTILSLVLLPFFIKLGFWQYDKAQQKLALQALHDERGRADPVALPPRLEDPVAWKYRRVALHGVYEPAFQVLVDNQISGGQAGYHVLTPLHLNGSDMRVLINRGWIPLGPDRQVLPVPDTPHEQVHLTGHIWLPPAKFYELGKPQANSGAWQTLWQNPDISRYIGMVPFPVQPVVVRLDPASPGGFIRDWPHPAERYQTNLGYAFQWFGFAVVLVILFVVVNVKKIECTSESNK